MPKRVRPPNPTGFTHERGFVYAPNQIHGYFGTVADIFNQINRVIIRGGVALMMTDDDEYNNNGAQWILDMIDPLTIINVRVGEPGAGEFEPMLFRDVRRQVARYEAFMEELFRLIGRRIDSYQELDPTENLP